ncbi:MAG: hypothetical protein IJ646_00470 [Clostridia bacterium]|nr:hypothetical protein [Clostridia bacterium]
MKKILALLMAMLMVIGMAAVAETADAKPTLLAGLSNVNLTVTDGSGNAQNIALEDLYLSAILDTKDGVQFVLQADQDEDMLCYLTGKLDGDKVVVAASGLDKAYEAEIPNNPIVGTEDLPGMLRAALPAMMSLKLPMLPAISLPKADLTPLVSLLGAQSTEADGVTTTTFSVPAEIVSMVIDQAADLLSATVESTPQLAQFSQLIGQLKESGLSFALEGTIADTEAEQSTTIAVYLATDGQTAADPALYLNMYSTVNNFTLAVDLPTEDSSYTIGQLTLVTDPDADTIDLGIDFAGMATLTVNFYKQAELQVAAVSLDVFGTEMGMQLSYGVKDDKDYVSFSGHSDAGEFTMEDTSVTEGDTAGGSFTLNFKTADMAIDLSADHFESLDDIDVSGYEIPANVVPIDQFSDDDAATAFQPLIEYISGVLSAEQPAA